jgi:hypothetical protein
LAVPGRPNRGAAQTLLAVALDDVGLSERIFVTTVIHSPQATETRGFRGLPTILIVGQNPFAD